MANLGVETSALVAVADELDSVAQGLRSGVSSLDNEVSSLLGSGWSGEAASAYSGVWQEWHEGAHQVVEGLVRMSALLQDAASRYSTTDGTGAAGISGVGL
ncbi:WXG100 family type VII secretion target [Mycolicibacterium moriokaense]|uniref:ESAT-6-like protein n=1 Tax=Mycolicibacterium moriokaense TaxID=39691 RepID=A0A318H824_9MYCO|nr:WXG100 family type VII secretion target [Mycolicibacterium moriokaense]PXX01490.1 WXG100 family type VII secretion target [Mycolicibacterium moriokaense]